MFSTFLFFTLFLPYSLGKTAIIHTYVADPQYTYLVKSTKMCEKKGNPRTMSRPTLAFVVKKGRNDYLKGGDLRVLIKSRRNFMDGIAAV